MSFNISMLASGSKANATLIESDGTKFLIDCGLSAKQLEQRLALLNVSPEEISAVLVTHEHSDHINGVSVFSRRWKIPVYSNYGTAQHLMNIYAHELFDTGFTFQIGNAVIHPFSINHDAAEPVGFVIYCNGLKLVHVTDIGKVNSLLIDMLKDAHAIVIESNHDLDLLSTCDYPWELKQRIASSHGHLSNCACAETLNEVYSSELGFVLLAHLSENSNRPELAKSTILEKLAERNFNQVLCASPYLPTTLIPIGEASNSYVLDYMQAA